jgi:hypothetical protein
MKKIILLNTPGLSLLFLFNTVAVTTQPVSPAANQRSVIGWMKICKFNGATKTTRVKNKIFSIARPWGKDMEAMDDKMVCLKQTEKMMHQVEEMENTPDAVNDIRQNVLHLYISSGIPTPGTFTEHKNFSNNNTL